MSSIDATPIILGRLYQGGVPPEGSDLRVAGFNAVVLCAREHQDGRYRGVTVLRCPMDDAELDRQTWRIANQIALTTTALCERGNRVLVTCHAGLNRSALITTLAMHFLTRLHGKRCVAHVQRQRRGALSNDSFRRALETLGDT